MSSEIVELVLNLPIKVISEANNYDHWSKKAARKKSQFEEVFYELHQANKIVQFPVTVNLVRIGPKIMDTDNLASAFKAVRDAIAKHFGVDDGEVNKIRFTYNQEPCKIRKYSIRIEIKPTNSQS